MVPDDIWLELEIAHRLTLGEWDCLLFNSSWLWGSQISDEKNTRATSVKVGHSDVNSLIWGLRFLGAIHIRRGLFIVGVNRYFSLIMHGFWSNNTLYSASLPFVLFIFLLTPFHTRVIISDQMSAWCCLWT